MVGGSSQFGNGAVNKNREEPLTAPLYVSIFITHYLNRPVENSGILRKLYLDFNLSMNEIVELTSSAWSKASILEAMKTYGITKEKSLTLRPPYGMCVTNGRLAHCEKEQLAIKLMLKLRSEGKPLREIAKHLDNRKIKSKTGCRWSATAINIIIKREFGKNKTKEEKIKNQGGENDFQIFN